MLGTTSPFFFPFGTVASNLPPFSLPLTTGVLPTASADTSKSADSSAVVSSLFSPSLSSIYSQSSLFSGSSPSTTSYSHSKLAVCESSLTSTTQSDNRASRSGKANSDMLAASRVTEPARRSSTDRHGGEKWDSQSQRLYSDPSTTRSSEYSPKVAHTSVIMSAPKTPPLSLSSARTEGLSSPKDRHRVSPTCYVFQYSLIFMILHCVMLVQWSLS